MVLQKDHSNILEEIGGFKEVIGSSHDKKEMHNVCHL